MQEIAPDVFIETSYVGVTLGAINWAHGIVLIDAPFLPDEIRSWRSVLLNWGRGGSRFLVNLDAHYDRTLGVQGMECTVVATEDAAQVFRDRPSSFKTQGMDSGAEWELHSGFGTIRWAPPEIIFTDQMKLCWNDNHILIDHIPGSSQGAIWIQIPEHRIIFLGDAVIARQPPFLASANIPVWVKAISRLLEPDFQDYLLVSGRDGLVVHSDVRKQIAFLENIHEKMERFAERGAMPEEISKQIPALLEGYQASPQRQFLYQQRLRHGLLNYYRSFYRIPTDEGLDIVEQ